MITPPSGHRDHSAVYRKLRMKTVRNGLIQGLTFLEHLATNDTFLRYMNGIRKSPLHQALRKAFDYAVSPLDRLLFTSVPEARMAFFGRKNPGHHKSLFGGLGSVILGKYLDDWVARQRLKQLVPRIQRDITPPPKTYVGWKRLREECQPGWRPFPTEGHLQVIPGDQMDPRERLIRLIEGKEADRVGFGPSWDYAVALIGGSNFWEFAYDGVATAQACVNTWIRTGGSDFLPDSFGLGAYAIPFPDSHSRFFFRWGLPTDRLPPQFLETEILKTYEELFNYGMSALAQEISKRLMRDLFVFLKEAIARGAVLNTYFPKDFQRRFLPYSQLIFATWDIVPMWRSMIPFMKDCRKNPAAIKEALDFVNKPMTDLMISLGKLIHAKTGLIGNSRGSNSWMSPKMFEEIFWPSMKYTFDSMLAAGIIPVCHLDNDWTQNMVFLAEHLPKRSCLFHLDQVDLVKVHDLIGDHFCLMGAFPPALTVNSLPHKVEEACKRYIDAIGTDGLILASGCEIPADIPIQNLYAMKRAILKHGIFRR